MNPLKSLVSAILKFFEHKKIHAFQVFFDGRIYFICARCSGLYLGLFLGLPIALFMLIFTPIFYSLGDVLTTLIAVLLALPTLLDWITQRLALRESKNWIRFISAFFAGFALAWYMLAPTSFLFKILFLIVVLVLVTLFSRVDRRSPTHSSDQQKRDQEKTSNLTDS